MIKLERISLPSRKIKWKRCLSSWNVMLWKWLYCFYFRPVTSISVFGQNDEETESLSSQKWSSWPDIVHWLAVIFSPASSMAALSHCWKPAIQVLSIQYMHSLVQVIKIICSKSHQFRLLSWSIVFSLLGVFLLSCEMNMYTV